MKTLKLDTGEYVYVPSKATLLQRDAHGDVKAYVYLKSSSYLMCLDPQIQDTYDPDQYITVFYDGGIYIVDKKDISKV